MAIRRALHRRGLRYRVNVRPILGLRRTADIAFTKAKLAVLVDGCFWHSCPEHGTLPLANREWWSEKLAGNATRDRETTTSWTNEGWTVLRFWEHDDPEKVADIVERALRQGERS